MIVMNTKLKNGLIEFLRAVLAALCGLVASLTVSSCGITKAQIKTSADNTASTITITTNNPTTVTADPQVELQYKPKSN